LGHMTIGTPAMCGVQDLCISSRSGVLSLVLCDYSKPYRDSLYDCVTPLIQELADGLRGSVMIVFGEGLFFRLTFPRATVVHVVTRGGDSSENVVDPLSGCVVYHTSSHDMIGLVADNPVGTYYDHLINLSTHIKSDNKWLSKIQFGNEWNLDCAKLGEVRTSAVGQCVLSLWDCDPYVAAFLTCHGIYDDVKIRHVEGVVVGDRIIPRFQYAVLMNSCWVSFGSASYMVTDYGKSSSATYDGPTCSDVGLGADNWSLTRSPFRIGKATGAVWKQFAKMIIEGSTTAVLECKHAPLVFGQNVMNHTGVVLRSGGCSEVNCWANRDVMKGLDWNSKEFRAMVESSGNYGLYLGKDYLNYRNPRWEEYIMGNLDSDLDDERVVPEEAGYDTEDDDNELVNVD